MFPAKPELRGSKIRDIKKAPRKNEEQEHYKEYSDVFDSYKDYAKSIKKVDSATYETHLINLYNIRKEDYMAKVAVMGMNKDGATALATIFSFDLQKNGHYYNVFVPLEWECTANCVRGVIHDKDSLSLSPKMMMN